MGIYSHFYGDSDKPVDITFTTGAVALDVESRDRDWQEEGMWIRTKGAEKNITFYPWSSIREVNYHEAVIE